MSKSGFKVTAQLTPKEVAEERATALIGELSDVFGTGHRTIDIPEGGGVVDVGRPTAVMLHVSKNRIGVGEVVRAHRGGYGGVSGEDSTPGRSYGFLATQQEGVTEAASLAATFQEVQQPKATMQGQKLELSREALSTKEELSQPRFVHITEAPTSEVVPDYNVTTQTGGGFMASPSRAIKRRCSDRKTSN